MKMLALAIASLCAALGSTALLASGLDVRLTPSNALGAPASQLDFSITNAGNTVVDISRWELPDAHGLGGLASPLFDVTQGGEPAAYIGKLVKRAPDSAADMIGIAPGQTFSAVVDVAEHYDLSAGGQFDVGYASAKTTGIGKATLHVPASLPKFDAGQYFPRIARQTNFRFCSADRSSQVLRARDSARGLTARADQVMSTPGSRYNYWFGSYNSGRYARVAQNMSKIRNAIDNADMTIDCSCTSNAFAYVYPNRPYEVFLCNAFWSAPETGTDSRAGTLAHEVSHFTVIAGTDDFAYGQSAARALATDNPARAIANADNHEYFVENTPNRD